MDLHLLLRYCETMSKVDLDFALEAVSEDLDTLGDGLADLAGSVEAVQNEVEETRAELRATNDKIDKLHDLIRLHVIPKLDRIGEIDELRGKVARVEVDLDRARLRVIEGGGE